MGIRSQNNPLAAYLDVFSNTGTDAAGEPVLESGLTASGGFVNDYTEGGIVYRAHIFTTNSQFQVTALGDYDNTVQYLVVGGGGGGGNDGGGGGGAGGVKSNHPAMPSPRRGAAFPGFCIKLPRLCRSRWSWWLSLFSWRPWTRW